MPAVTSPSVKRRSPVTRRPNPPLADAAALCWSATVQAREGDALWLARPGVARTLAHAAASCLLLPVPGDTVACIGTADGDAWVLAVLRRAETSQPRVLQCEGETHLVVRGGSLRVDAPELRFEAKRLDVDVQAASLSTDSAEFSGRQLRVVAGTVKLIGHALSTVMERVNHFSHHYLRTTKGLDRVKATHIECEAEQLLRLQGEHALINGAKLVKTRGAQIHFG